MGLGSEGFCQFRASSFPRWQRRFDLRTLMFIPNIRATFSDEQQAHWLPRAQAWEVVGCYAGGPGSL